MIQPVRTRREFSALSSSRVRGRSGPVWIVRAELPADHLDDASPAVPVARVAYAIGRVVGGAVVRNRVKRRLRAIIADLDRSGALSPGLYLVGVKPAVVDQPHGELDGHVRRALDGATVRPVVASPLR